MSKSTVAIVLLSLLLVLSLILTATGAWFTDTKTSPDKDLSFGTLKLDAITLDGVAVANTIDTANLNLMPGSTISGKVAVKNSGNSAAWIRYKVTFSGEGAADLTLGEGYGEYQYVETALAGNASMDIEIAASVAKTVGNSAQGKEVKLVIVVEALQQANTAATNVAATWDGVTVVAVA